MESPWVSGMVIFLICVDLTCTVINTFLEETDLLNPKYEEGGEATATVTHNICVAVLVIFLVEQLLHVVIFGAEFFKHPWYVLDLFVVCISLICETTLEGLADDVIPVLILLRLWKVAAFIFDVALAEHEKAEVAEKSEPNKKERDSLTETLDARLPQGFADDIGAVKK